MYPFTEYILHLADDALILGHRNSEWTGHGPILEQDIALSNIALDLIGQARHLYQLAAEQLQQHSATESRITEDTLAYLRDARDFKNCLLVEQENGDWGKTILRQFFFSAYQFPLYKRLMNSNNQQLAAIAEKSVKEVAYHLRWSSEWVIRLGDGTDESHMRMQKSMDELWQYTGELFTPSKYELETALAGIGINPEEIKNEWEQKVEGVLIESSLLQSEQRLQSLNTWMKKGGKDGVHTEQLGYLLAEMQFLQRAYPNSEW
jgi:ring-1,2-phenylacetyl-CoA epoxidase subunit PaaC